MGSAPSNSGSSRRPASNHTADSTASAVVDLSMQKAVYAQAVEAMFQATQAWTRQLAAVVVEDPFPIEVTLRLPPDDVLIAADLSMLIDSYTACPRSRQLAQHIAAQIPRATFTMFHSMMQEVPTMVFTVRWVAGFEVPDGLVVYPMGPNGPLLQKGGTA